MAARNRSLIAGIFLLTLAAPLCASETEPGRILQRVKDKYSALKTYRSLADVEMVLSFSGDMPNSIYYSSEIILEKGSGFAVINSYGLLGKSTFSDGEKMWIYVPALQRYTVFDAPPSEFDYLAADPMSIDTIGTERFLLFSLISGRISPPAGSIRASYGDLEGETHTILEFSYGGPNYRVWIDTFSYTVLRIELEAIPEFYDSAAGDDITFNYLEIHRNIEFDTLPSDHVFRFVPSRGDMISEELYPEEHTYESLYLGEDIPLFSYIPLGEEIETSLTDTLEQHGTVLIFFWDILSESSSKMGQALTAVSEETGAPVISVNTSDTRKAVRDFVEKTGFSFSVAIDESGAIANRYMVESFPTLFIASSGKIKHIYTGYFDGIRNKILEDIRLLVSPGRINRRQQGLTRKWHLDIRASGIAAHGNSVAAATVSDELYDISHSGRILNITNAVSGVRRIIATGKKGIFAGYRPNGRKIVFFDTEGSSLGAYTSRGGISSVNPFRGLLAVSQSGNEGAALLSGEGGIIWESSAVNSAVYAFAGDLDATGKIDVAAADGGSSFYLLDESGKLESSVNTELKLDFIKIAGSGSILISGVSRGSQILALVDINAHPAWELTLGSEGSARITSCRLHPLNDWVAFGTLDGQVFVFDMSGRLLAYTREGGMNVQLDWMEVTPGQHRLVAATIEGGVSCYIITETE